MRKYLSLFVLLFVMLVALLATLPAAAGMDHGGKRSLKAGQEGPAIPIRPDQPFLEPPVRTIREHTGEMPGVAYGWIGVNLGDLNGDNSNEYMLTAPYYGAYEGKAYVYNGADGALLATHMGDPYMLLGYSGAQAGDVNADGVGDYIIGGPGLYSYETIGQVRVISGADHSVLYQWDGDPAMRFGASVAGINDVNGDGFDDVLVASAAYGSTLGLAGPDGPGRVTLFSGQDGSVLWTFDGMPGDLLGGGAGRVEDLDNDGVDDVVAAAAGANGFTGRAYVLSGADGTLIHTLLPAAPLSPSGTYGVFFAKGAGDVDADGLEDIFIGDYGHQFYDGRAYVYSGATGQPIHVFEAESPMDSLGPGRGIGDFDGDGHDDLIIASWLSADAVTEGGKVSIYSGADGSILRTATGTVPYDELGVDALPLGDINGDNQPDFLVTAVGLDFYGLDVGHSYIITFKPGEPLPIRFQAP